jgi:hypothetical protein
MAQAMMMVSGRIAEFAARQPRVAVGGGGLGGILLVELAAFLLGHPLV